MSEVELIELDFEQPRENDGHKYIEARDPLGLMKYSFYHTSAYEPSEEESDWLREQLTTYCRHYFPNTGMFANRNKPSQSARALYDLLTDANSFGAVYSVLVGNIPPQYSLEILLSDISLTYLQNCGDERANVLSQIRDMVWGVTEQSRLDEILQSEEVERMQSALTNLPADDSEFLKAIRAYVTLVGSL